MRSYRLDASSQIVSVDGTWDAFARKNDGAGALAERVVGQLLWEFVSGEATQTFLERQFYDCRRTDSLLARTYRCDSPTHERLFRMEISPAPGNRILVGHHQIRSRMAPWSILRDSSGVRGFRRCSQCLSCNSGAFWYDHRHFRPPGAAIETYTICPTCLAASASHRRRPWPRFGPIAA
jgi:hypothetical protein